MRVRTKTTIRNAALVGIALLASSIAAPQASAAGPRWQLSVTPVPTHLQPGGEGQIVLLAWNLGGESEGAPVTITDNLPAGVTATSIHTISTFAGNGIPETMTCAPLPAIACTWSKATAPFNETLTPDGFLEVTIKVKVEGSARDAIDEARVEGGEAPTAAISQPLHIGGGPSSFGFERYEFRPENEDGSLDTQAGSHPFQMTTTLGFDSTFEAGVPKPAAMVKDLHLELPPGLIGDPQAVPRCTVEQFTTNRLEGDYCPPETAVGLVLTTVREPAGKIGNPQEPITTMSPLFNLTPAPGEPARLGFVGAVVPIVLDTALRSGGDYGVTINNSKIPETAEVLAARVTVWGDPGDPSHNASRGWGCLRPSQVEGLGGCPPPTTARPFLTLPTSCGRQLESSVEADSWATPSKGSEVAAPLSYTLRDGAGRPVALDGCDRLPFDPSLSLAPDTQAANSPAGLKMDLRVPQDTTLAPDGLAESDLKDTTVALPEGMQVSPSSATGLEACSEESIGFSSRDASGTSFFSPSAPLCPEASKVGTVHIKTPLLPNELEGSVYLSAQNANPFGSLLALYIVAHDPVSGVLVKLAGEVHLDEHSGQVVTTFENTPQLPFEDLKLEIFGGSHGSLSTPAYCGTYTTVATFAPWSGASPASLHPTFPIDTGPDGSACASPLPFAPSLLAGTTSSRAGAFAPFTTVFSREDGNQNLGAVQLQMPQGLLGKLASVTLCPEPQASEGTCGPASEIGHTVVSVGLGSDPYTVTGGRVFITGAYKGASYGLSITEPAKAGPFDLGSGPCDCAVVRAKIDVDPHTSALTVASDPLPLMLKGVPLQVKHVDVTIDRPGFTFNPTNCSQAAISGRFSGEQGASAQASAPFQVTNCATLPFRPKFAVLTKAKTTKANGAFLHVKVSSGAGQANIKQVRVDLPRQLPSRLTTLQKACLAAVFEANPASCPAGSVVGQGTAVTPVLRGRLTGPAYLVSHGNEAFPDLEIVLQGEGITLILDGQTKITKGITSSFFNAVPDAPVSTFDLVLPQGPHSVLTGFGSLCKKPLLMPTRIVGQNGAVIKQFTRIGVSGCPRHKAHKRKHKARRGKSRR